MIEGFLLGSIATASFSAALFFLKFWRKTRDLLFLAFAVAFFLEGANRSALLLANQPNEASVWYYVVRSLSYLLILAAILWKNYGAQ
jgi:hypothetical protein